ncbi:Transcriptional activator domain protein [Frankia canadensis]|uniref:Transcriptional activator domain protein n=1 Tax=Frankia canadensis TaxID=1836972 RepID=A0A2I2L1F0_9ACTN|nr:AAA family ATPase [Frankia canadensis]SNQ51756.1 Transcriptional activator domain protein [Frankia canadensis]SOU59046.1 Transcriptional activator domain protein [Frankia canadensis]
MTHALEVRLFGTPRIRLDGEPVVLASSRALSLLACLVLRAGRPQRRDQLAFLLWPDSTEKQARTNLRHVLHTLRAAIPDMDRFLHATPQALSWHESWCDVARFREALDAARRPGADVVGQLRTALDLYPGELLHGWYDEWVLPERAQLHRLALAAVGELVPLLEAREEHDAALRYAGRAVELDPLDEQAYQALMRQWDARGDRTRAMRVYHECVTTLRDELNVEPSAATRAAYEALLPRDHDEAPALRPSDFVGRSAQRRTLTERWQDSRRGRAQLVLVTGEPGVGKSRLVEELRLWAAHRGASTAAARSYAVEGTLAYAPLVTWLRAPGIARGRGRLDRRYLDALARLLPESPRDPAPARPGSAPAVPPAGTARSDESAAEEPASRVRLFEAAARALLAGSEPVLLVADDLHAADAYTLQFLHYLLRTEPGAPLLVVATARLADAEADDQLRRLLTGLRALERYTEIELARLDRTETGVLAERLAGHRMLTSQLDRLYAETAGNPLFVIETLRSGWPSHGEPNALTPRVHAVLEARLGQVSAGARALLGLAATVGASVDVDVLARLYPGDEDGFTRDLDELWRRQLLLASGADRYDFSHDKLREVAYQALSPARRRHHHRLVARALQDADADPDRLDALAGQIAAHLVEAGARSEAVGWYERAAASAQRVHADAEAVRLLAQALAMLRRAPDSRGRQESELALLTAMLGPLAAAHGYASDRLGAVLDAALELARRLGVPPGAPVLRAQGMAVLSRGDAEAAREVGGQLRALGGADDVLAVEGAFVQGVTAYWRGDLATARTHLEAALARYRPENRSAHLRLFAQDPQPLCVARLAHVHAFLGDPAEAVRLQSESLALAHAVRHPFTLGAVLLFAGLLDLELAALPALRRHAAQLEVLRRQVENTPVQLVSDALCGFLEVADGRTTAGLARVDAALADPGRHAAPGLPAILLRVRLAACERTADRDGSAETARRLLAEPVRVWDARARAVLGEQR